MAGPSWLAGTFAAIMIATAAYSASRLALFRMRGRVTELDADALHALMGTAMAGMLAPQFHVLPGSAWAAVFGIAAAWFGWHTMRAPVPRASSRSLARHPLPHLVECVAMLYMLLQRPAHATAGTAMPGMAASGEPAASFPALAVVLALFMLGYIVWTTDRLTSPARANTSAAGPRRTTGYWTSAAAGPAARNHGATAASNLAAGTRHGDQPDRPALAPKLAACGKIAMSITMGYMLILMI